MLVDKIHRGFWLYTRVLQEHRCHRSYGKTIQHRNWGELPISARTTASILRPSGGGGAEAPGVWGRCPGKTTWARISALPTPSGRGAGPAARAHHLGAPAPGRAFAGVAEVPGGRPTARPAALALAVPAPHLPAVDLVLGVHIHPALHQFLHLPNVPQGRGLPQPLLLLLLL